ncbi:MAG: MFS transporter [Negativicutes bacterium]|nr:MFS transporter [Negativicutes bacterium]
MSMPLTAGLKKFFFALRSRNYRLFFCGQIVSLCGTWMQTMALGWLAYRLTGSSTVVGLIWFLIQAPSLVLSPLAGVLADRGNRRQLLIAIQTGFLAQAALLAGFTISGRIDLPLLLALSALQGLINSCDFPVRQALVGELLDRAEDLPNAIALNSFTVNAARIVGPAIAGLITYGRGEGLCFALNALSYLAVIVSLAMIRTRAAGHHSACQPAGHPRSHWHSLASGLRYAWQHIHIRGVLALLLVVSFIGTSYMALLPAFVRDDLRGAADGMGLLMTAAGTGAVLAALLLARNSGRPLQGLERQLGLALLVSGLSFVILSRCSSLAAACWVMPIAGFSLSFLFSGCNTFTQSVTEPALRGRVMGVYALIWNGISPFGSLLYGFLAEHLGTAPIIGGGGLAIVLAAVVYLSQVRKISRAAGPAGPGPV